VYDDDVRVEYRLDGFCLTADHHHDVSADGTQCIDVQVHQGLISDLEQCFGLSHSCGTSGCQNDSEINNGAAGHASMLPQRAKEKFCAVVVAGFDGVSSPYADCKCDGCFRPLPRTIAG